MKWPPILLPTVWPLINGSKTSAPRMKPPFGLMNVAFADHGPLSPWNSARTHQLYCLLKSRRVAGVQLNALPVDCSITAPESLNSWKWYCGLMLAPCVAVAAAALSVGCPNVSSRTLLMGDCGEGAVTFRVDPSDGVTVAGVGVV